jgi:hypothetical protein
MSLWMTVGGLRREGSRAIAGAAVRRVGAVWRREAHGGHYGRGRSGRQDARTVEQMDEPVFPSDVARFYGLQGLSARSTCHDVLSALGWNHRQSAFQMARYWSPTRVAEQLSGGAPAPIRPLGLATDRVTLPSKGVGVRWEIAVRVQDAPLIERLNGLPFSTHCLVVQESTEARYRQALASLPFPVGTPGIIIRFLPSATTEADVRVFLERFRLAPIPSPIRIVRGRSANHLRLANGSMDPLGDNSLPPEATAVVALADLSEATRACIDIQGAYFYGIGSLSPGKQSVSITSRNALAVAKAAAKQGINVSLGAGLADDGDSPADDYVFHLNRWIQAELYP